MSSLAMLRGLRLFRLLLSLVLCLQSGLAVAHCLRLVAAPQHVALQVEICTVDGIVMMELGGAADQDAPHGHDHAGFCPACHALPQILLPDPPAIPMPAGLAVAAPQAGPEAGLPLGARAPPYQPRGPPTLS